MCSKRYIKYYSFADAYTEAIKDNPIKNDSTNVHHFVLTERRLSLLLIL